MTAGTRISSATVAAYAAPALRQRLYRRTLFTVAASQVLGGAGLAAGVTVGALLAQEMLGETGFAGLPVALFTLGSAGAAFLIGRLSQRSGRRVGLSTGFLVGGVGAAGIVLAAVIGSVPLLFAALLVYGAGTASNLQARYAGTDLAKPSQRGTAVSVALVATTLGAVAGPNLVAPLGDLATSLGIPALAGPFLLAAVAYTAAALVLFVWLRPDPFLLAAAVAKQEQQGAPSAIADAAGSTASTASSRGITVGATVMVLTQVAMVAIMTMTPVHMLSHGHGLGEVGMVIGIHIGAMYLPSLITGILVDKLGRTVMAIASGVTLLAAGLVAATAPGESITQLIIALALLGLGWNFGLISGTALLVDATPPATRARTQGSVDVLIALAGAAGGALSGMVVAGSSFALLSLAGGVLSILLIPVLLWSRRAKRVSLANA